MAKGKAGSPVQEVGSVTRPMKRQRTEAGEKNEEKMDFGMYTLTAQCRASGIRF